MPESMAGTRVASGATTAGETALWRRRSYLLIAAMAALKLLAGATTGLMDTEAYYAAWAYFPSLSYYDHAPLAAWICWLALRVSSSAFALRLGFVLCAIAFELLLRRLAERLFSPRAAFWTLATAAMVPVLYCKGFFVNPEGPLGPLWVLALLCLDDLRRRDEPWRPALLGLVVGLGFLAKYTALLAVPVVLLQLATSPRGRRWLARPSFYLGSMLAALPAAPVILWNARRGWPSVNLHLFERMAAPTAAHLWRHAGEVLVGQAVFFHPLLLPALAAAVGLTLVRARRDERFRFLAVAAVPVLCFLFAMMLCASDSEPQWTVVGWVPAMVAVGAWVDERWGRLPRWAVRHGFACAAMAAVALGLYGFHIASPALLRFIPPAAYDPARDPINETLGWTELASAARAAAAGLGPKAVVATSHNVLCGHLLLALGDSPQVYCPNPRRTEFDFVGRGQPPADAPVLYVASSRYPDTGAFALPGRDCRPDGTVAVTRGGRSAGRFQLLACPPRGPAPPPAVASRSP